MKTAIGYVRVSTTEQANEGLSLEAQRARIAAWCLLNGFALGALHVDAGISGKRSKNRPGLQAALDQVCECGGVLVVYSLSRLARSVKDTMLISERLNKANADLASLSEKIDTTSAAGKMIFRMLAVFAEFESDVISERVSAIVAHKRSKGELLGKVPYGYDLASDGCTLTPNTDEQATLALIDELKNVHGMSLRAIAAEMNQRGVKTKEGKGVWSFGTIRRIVRRPKVAA